jgi:hypothetical protein
MVSSRLSNLARTRQKLLDRQHDLAEGVQKRAAVSGGF